MSRAAGMGDDRSRIGRVDDGEAVAKRSPAQLFALVFGAVYILVGVLGFLVTGFDDFANRTGEVLVLFGVNPLHNIVHIAIGAVWVVSAAKHNSAKAVNTAIGAVYLILGILGLVDLGILGFINHNTADGWLHVVSGALGLFFGTKGATSSSESR